MSEPGDGPLYPETIRDVLPQLIGRTIVDLSQHDRDEREEEGSFYLELHLDNGGIVRVHWTGDVDVVAPDGAWQRYCPHLECPYDEETDDDPV
jgi:hypothetical protein